MRKTLRVIKERVILVAAKLHVPDARDDLAELTALAESAGAVVVDKFQQKIRKINPALYIGTGKANQLAQRARRFKADAVVFDNDLSPNQIRELEKITRVKVLDRSELILDIFATRAKTKQAKLQVELAQLEYTYPRLTRMWAHLDSVAGAGGATAAGVVGGIGTRGPGEQQLEIDRRLVNRRVTDLKRSLAHIDKQKVLEIKGRTGLFKICLVGYTNSGKSTLLNALTNAGVFVEDRLFATLDTRTRKWTLGRGAVVLLSDTVGFVENLPHQLVASFKATLEEAINADLLLHIVDAANPSALKQIESVDEVLTEIGCAEKPILKVLNKIDVIKTPADLELLQTLFADAVSVSARKGLYLEHLKRAVHAKYKGQELLLRISVSQSNSKVPSFLSAFGQIVKQQYRDGFVIIEARLGQNQLPDLKRLGSNSLEIVQM